MINDINWYLDRLDKIKRAADGSYTACCPAHDDRNPSLSIKQVDDRVLLKCFAGCTYQAILDALGAPKPRFVPFTAPSTPQPKKPATVSKEPVFTAESPFAAEYIYLRSDGSEAYRMRRYSLPDGDKTFRAWHPDGRGGFKHGKGDQSVIPYRLNHLATATPGETVFLVEGEKHADLLAEHGLLATTSPHGANSWKSELAAYFSGFDVVILPDNDEPGFEYATKAASSIHPHAERVRIVELPGLPPAGDVVDWFEAGHTLGELLACVANTPAYDPSIVAETVNRSYSQVVSDHQPPSLAWPELPPFPIHALGERLAQFVENRALVLDVPADMIAMPLLAAIRAFSGNKIDIRAKAGFQTIGSVWFVVIAPPGSRKTPSMKAALEPAHSADHEYQQILAMKARNTAGGDKGTDLSHQQGMILTDLTIEGLLKALSNSNGMLVFYDEIIRLIGGFGRYSNAPDSERGQINEIWQGASVYLARATKEPIRIERPFVSIVGGLPLDLRSATAHRMGNDGFLDRFLVSIHHITPSKWNDHEADPALTKAMHSMLLALCQDQDPRTVALGPESQSIFTDWYDLLAEERRPLQFLNPGLDAALAKYPNHLLAIALTLHLVKNPFRGENPPVSTQTMLDAIEILDYFKAHLHRLHPSPGNPRASGDDRILVKIPDNWITRSDLHAALGGRQRADTLDAALARLEAAGLIESIVNPRESDNGRTYATTCYRRLPAHES
jgi:hypothetical protein